MVPPIWRKLRASAHAGDDEIFIPSARPAAKVVPSRAALSAGRQETDVTIDRRDEVVETVVEQAPVETVEERIVEQDGSVSRVVRAVGEPVPVAVVAQTVVTRPAPVRRTVSRIWRRSSVPAQATTEYTAVEGYG